MNIMSASVLARLNELSRFFQTGQASNSHILELSKLLRQINIPVS